jgi:hypothetical protein
VAHQTRGYRERAGAFEADTTICLESCIGAGGGAEGVKLEGAGDRDRLRSAHSGDELKRYRSYEEAEALLRSFASDQETGRSTNSAGAQPCNTSSAQGL